MNPYLEIILRTVTVYLFIIAALRLFGKTELAQLSVFDLVFILLLSNSVQNAMVGPDSSLPGGILAAGSLFILNFLIKRILYKHKGLSDFLQGEPVVLISNGKLIKKNLDKVRITHEELDAAIREHGVDVVENVDLAVLEMDGNISILSDNFKKHSVRKRRAHKIIQKSS
jgi:uncharacterized membrane protein YcaP (DUF421 family)